jgi:citrate lyase beta subunit
MIEKAKGLPADEVFLDLEDAVAPDAKAQARKRKVLEQQDIQERTVERDMI